LNHSRHLLTTKLRRQQNKQKMQANHDKDQYPFF
jgi:hypothetical protein